MRITYKEKYNEAVRELLRGLRLQKNLSQNQVLRKSGVDVSKHESNHCSPRVTSIISLCELYEIDLTGFWLVHELYLNRRITLKTAVNLLNQREEQRLAIEIVYGVILRRV